VPIKSREKTLPSSGPQPAARTRGRGALGVGVLLSSPLAIGGVLHGGYGPCGPRAGRAGRNGADRHSSWHHMTMQPKRTPEQSFRARLEGSERGRVYLVLPFDPVKVWGLRTRYHVRGTINGIGVRGVLQRFGKGYFLPLGPVYRRGAGLQLGDAVSVVLMLEGPQRDSVAPDIAGALAAEPDAARFFDGLATFYRKNYLRWIDATKRNPGLRAQRIAELVELMKAGKKMRPH
jgi:hypothetical protein